jgi:hypothetical protein
MAIRPNGRQVPKETTAQAIYHKSIAKHVHELLWMGYSRMIPQVFQHSEETDITGALIKMIREATEAMNAPSWVKSYTIHDDPPLNTEGRQGRRRRRVDIEFERTQRGPRPRFQLEAKRLGDTKTSVGLYLGPDGLGCFFAGRDAYAQGHTEAGMLGYVQTDTEKSWAARIQAALAQAPTRYSLMDTGQWERVVIIPTLYHTYCTKHNRVARRLPLTLYHILLGFY